jgi:hypothetical protein
VLFSNDQVAALLNRYFEPAWESVRPVPLVRIDFGNGNVLTRTLHGNVVTYSCDTDGRALDALPGIYTPEAYRDRLKQLRLLAGYVARRPADQRDAWVRSYHRRQADALASGQSPEQFAERRGAAPITKRVIETPVEIVLQTARPGVPSEPTPLATPADVQEPQDVASWTWLAEDTALNESTRRRQIHEALAEAGLVRPEALSRRFYKEVLHADLDDPYLGLGPTLFATYPFAREDAGR